ncbi:MAG: ABC transporter substrate-binding protein [Chloroflexota bacterium]
MVQFKDLEELLKHGDLDRGQFIRASAMLGVSMSAVGAILNGGADVAAAACRPSSTPARVPRKAKYKVGFSQSELNNPWRTAETESMQAVAKMHSNRFIYTWNTANSSTNKQVSNVEDFIAQKVDFIVVTPREQDPLRAATAKALAACIPVFEIDRTSKGKAGIDYVTFIGSDFVLQGKKVGRWMVQHTTGPINYVELYGTTGATPAILRRQGFHNVIDKHARFKLLAGQDGNFTLADGKRVMQNFISKYGNKIDMVYCHNDDMAFGAYQALQSAGITKKVYIGTIDGQKKAIQFVANGKFSVCVQSDPRFGPLTFKTIDNYIAGKRIPAWVVVQDHTYVKANAASLLSTGF